MEDVVIALSCCDDDDAFVFSRMSDLAVLVSVLAWCRASFFLAAMTSRCNALEDAASEHANAVASVHPDIHAVCRGANEHPIKVTVRAVVRSSLIKTAV